MTGAVRGATRLRGLGETPGIGGAPPSRSSSIASERFKSVITGDLLDAPKAYGRDVVQFRAEAQHVYAANQLPPFRGGMDAGVRRRLIVVEFLRTIPLSERIVDIGKRIAREEPDALLAWAGRRRPGVKDETTPVY